MGNKSNYGLSFGVGAAVSATHRLCSATTHCCLDDSEVLFPVWTICSTPKPVCQVQVI